MIRVHKTKGAAEDYDANKIDIAPDGSLLLSKVTQRAGPQKINQATMRMEQTMEYSSELVRAIRRDLWTEVEAIGDNDADLILMGDSRAIERAK